MNEVYFLLEPFLKEAVSFTKRDFGVEIGEKANGDRGHLDDEPLIEVLLRDEFLLDKGLAEHGRGLEKLRDRVEGLLGDLPAVIKDLSQPFVGNIRFGKNKAAVLKIQVFQGVAPPKSQMAGLPVEINVFEKTGDMNHGTSLILSKNNATLNKQTGSGLGLQQISLDIPSDSSI
jgi:hypothetical protein